MKKCVLELGGSDPYLILADADIGMAAEKCIQSRFQNGGQSCIAAKRFIVVKDVRYEFEEACFKIIESLKYGDPTDKSNDIGPLAREDLRNQIHDQVQTSLAEGAQRMHGGELPTDRGFYYPPTLLTDVGPGMPAYEEEVFGPVAAIISAEDDDDAVRIANDSTFGLGAAVFTADLEKGQRIAETELEAGFCCVNDFVRSDPRLPFGGIKESGYGRELGEMGIREFTNPKTIFVN